MASSSSPLDVDGPPVRRSPPVGSGAAAARRQLSDEQGKSEGAEQRGVTQTTTSAANGNSKVRGVYLSYSFFLLRQLIVLFLKMRILVAFET